MKHRKPTKFDRNLIVIGAGCAGLVTAYIAAAVKAKVTLIEKHQMGGDCLNTGCVPSQGPYALGQVCESSGSAAQEFGFEACVGEARFRRGHGARRRQS